MLWIWGGNGSWHDKPLAPADHLDTVQVWVPDALVINLVGALASENFFTRFRDPEDAVCITSAQVAENVLGGSELLAGLVWVTNSRALDALMHVTTRSILVVLAGVAPTFFMHRATDLSCHPSGC